MPVMIDLHSHTTFSDGEYSPTQLVSLAKKAGIKVLAITDHDTVDGLVVGEAAAREQNITLVCGIELSADLNNREVHILGHFIDYRSEAIVGLAQQQQLQRYIRAEEIVERLVKLGMRCSVEDMLVASNGKNICRPHIARVLLNRGYVRSIAEAFERFLGAGKPAYVHQSRLPAGKAVETIRESGGTATLAHPYLNQVTSQEIVKLQKEGIVGLEVGHPSHPLGVQSMLRALAYDLGLIPTAGTDFHGFAVLPDRALGMAKMNRIDWERLQAVACK